MIPYTTQARERERVYLPQNKEQTYKNILNISAVTGYQKGKPIKLVAYSTNYIGSSCNTAIRQNIQTYRIYGKRKVFPL